MKRSISIAAIALLALALAPAGAQAAFGINSFKVAFTEADGSPSQAGVHPFAMTVSLGNDFDPETLIPGGWLKDITVAQPPGLAGDVTAYPACTTAQFLDIDESTNEPSCPPASQVGIAAISAREAGTWETHPLLNVAPPPGVLLRLGIHILTQNVFIDVSLNQSPPYNALAASINTPQLIEVFGSKIQIWGNPSDHGHDELRGTCGHQSAFLEPGDIEGFEFEDTGESCPLETPVPKPFLTTPTYCGAPLPTSFQATSWEGEADSGESSIPTLFGCEKLNFHPAISALPTNKAAQSPTGLDFTLAVSDQGLTLTNPEVRAQSDVRKTVVTFPAGVTINPSQAEGLAVCSEADLRRETLAAEPGEGCPEASKIGTVEVQSPLVSEAIKGSLFVAEPERNLAENSLIAVYLVIKNRRLGVIVKQPIKVEPDPRTGRLVSTAEEIPQLPFSSFHLHFREGGRSPLVTPPLCGSYETTAKLTPWSGAAPYATAAPFQIVSGPDGASCPAAGPPPFRPGFEAGSLNPAAGHSSPFAMQLTRRDGDADLTRFDAALPPGVGAILAGVDRCPEAQIALAKSKTGKAELRSPSCPANSKIGRVEAGAGVGSQLTYVPGSIYLAGPFAGAPVSVVAVVPAVAGPFDVGTVVTRQALQVNPRTGEVRADGSRSDPIPHILRGIPLVVRDVQVHVDRPGFTYTPTRCDPFATKADIWGGGADPFSSLDDSPVAKEARYQAASCESLGFKPRLDLRLRGGTRRAAFPALRLTYRPRSGDANLKRLALRFPHSEFVEQGHFRTICTRVQFAAGQGNGAQCPANSIYGQARVFTPILSEPLEGPVFLRSSDHSLPDAVLALRGPPSLPIAFEVDTRIDSIHGGLRAIAQDTPDAPVTKVVVNMRGGQKGLFVNSTDLCRAPHRAHLGLEAQNGKQSVLKPLLRVGCGK